MTDFELLKKQKIEEVEKLFQEYEVEVQKSFERGISPYFDIPYTSEGKTIKLSNSTTPMLCY